MKPLVSFLLQMYNIPSFTTMHHACLYVNHVDVSNIMAKNIKWKHQWGMYPSTSVLPYMPVPYQFLTWEGKFSSRNYLRANA